MKKLSVQMLSVIWVILLGACVQTEEVNPELASDCRLKEVKLNGVKFEDFSYDANGNLTQKLLYVSSGDNYAYENLKIEGKQLTTEVFAKTPDSNEEFYKIRTCEILLDDSGNRVNIILTGYDKSGRIIDKTTQQPQYNPQGYLTGINTEKIHTEASGATNITKYTTSFIYDDANNLKQSLHTVIRGADNFIIAKQTCEYEFFEQPIFKPFEGIPSYLPISRYSFTSIGQMQGKLLKKITETITPTNGQQKVTSNSFEYKLADNGCLDKATQTFTDFDGSTQVFDYDYIK